MRNEFFIIKLNATVSVSVKKTKPVQQPRGGNHQKKIMLSV